MKKLLVLLFVVTTTLSYAQESALLRVNYKKGDTFLMTMKQTMDSPAVVTDTEMTMSMTVNEVADNLSTVETKFTAIKFSGMQGGMPMAYDSTKSDEDLDQMGMTLKGQFAPILKMVVLSKYNNLGEVLEVAVEPSNPMMEQQMKTQGMTFPEKEIKVGDTWKEETNQQGMKLVSEYKVKEITADKVVLTVSGTASGMGEGTISGVTTIDRETGITASSNVITEVTAMGQKMKIGIQISMKKQ